MKKILFISLLIVILVIIGLAIYWIYFRKSNEVDTFFNITTPLPSIKGRYVRITAPQGQPIAIAGVFIYDNYGKNIIQNYGTASINAPMQTPGTNEGDANNALKLMFSTPSPTSIDRPLLFRQIITPDGNYASPLTLTNYYYQGMQLTPEYPSGAFNTARSQGGGGLEWWQYDFINDVNISIVEIYPCLTYPVSNQNLRVEVLDSMKNPITPALLTPSNIPLQPRIIASVPENNNGTGNNVQPLTLTMLNDMPIPNMENGNTNPLYFRLNNVINPVTRPCKIELLFKYTTPGIILTLSNMGNNHSSFLEVNNNILSLGLYDYSKGQYIQTVTLNNIMSGKPYYCIINLNYNNTNGETNCFMQIMDIPSSYSSQMINTTSSTIFPTNEVNLVASINKENTSMNNLSSTFTGILYGLTVWPFNFDPISNNSDIYKKYSGLVGGNALITPNTSINIINNILKTPITDSTPVRIYMDIPATASADVMGTFPYPGKLYLVSSTPGTNANKIFLMTENDAKNNSEYTIWNIINNDNKSVVNIKHVKTGLYATITNSQVGSSSLSMLLLTPTGSQFNISNTNLAVTQQEKYFQINQTGSSMYYQFNNLIAGATPFLTGLMNTSYNNIFSVEPATPNATPNAKPSSTPTATLSASPSSTSGNQIVINLPKVPDFPNLPTFPILPEMPLIDPKQISDLISSGKAISMVTPQGIVSPGGSGPTTDIIQTNFLGNSNVYSPFLYYDKATTEKFISGYNLNKEHFLHPF